MANLELKNVTLVAISSINIDETIASLEQSMNGINYYEVILITHQKPECLPNKIKFKPCIQIKNINEYSKFMLYDLFKYINTEFALVVQYDGYVLRPEKWSDEFLKYDYVGAPWPKNLHFDKNGINIRVGNGGFSLRSKKLLKALNELKLPFTDNGSGYYNEDGVITNYYKKELGEYGVRLAPVSVASKFSREMDCDDSESEPFGFHKYKKNVPKIIMVNRLLRIAFRKILCLQKKFICKIKKFIKSIINTLHINYFQDKNGIIPLDKMQIEKLISNDRPVIFEIGAADGLDTLEFIKVFDNSDFKMYCFEPDPRNIASFKEKVRDKRVELVEMAVGDKDGKMQFHQSETVYSSSLKKPNLKNLYATWPFLNFDKILEVKTTTIDTFIRDNKIDIVDFIWADVQGAEDLILKGAETSLTGKIKYIYTEYSNTEYYEGEPTLNKILEILGNNWEVIKDYKTDVLLKNKNL